MGLYSGLPTKDGLQRRLYGMGSETTVRNGFRDDCTEMVQSVFLLSEFLAS